MAKHKKTKPAKPVKKAAKSVAQIRQTFAQARPGAREESRAGHSGAGG